MRQANWDMSHYLLQALKTSGTTLRENHLSQWFFPLKGNGCCPGQLVPLSVLFLKGSTLCGIPGRILSRLWPHPKSETMREVTARGLDIALTRAPVIACGLRRRDSHLIRHQVRP